MWSTGRRGGFTLVELTVVLVIVAVLSAAIVPRVGGSISATRLRAAAGRLQAAAIHARQFAVTRQCVCRLRVDVKEGRYFLEAQPDPAGEPDRFEVLVGLDGQDRLEPGVRFGKVRLDSPAEGGDLVIRFEPTGRADGAVVELRDERRIYSLIIAPTSGRARLVEAAVDELPSERFDLDA